MDLIKMMADAWDAERLRYQVRTQGGREGCWLAWADTSWSDGEIQAFPDVKSADAHLSRLCAAVQLRALQEAGYGVAKQWCITSRREWGATEYDGDLIPSALEPQP